MSVVMAAIMVGEGALSGVGRTPPRNSCAPARKTLRQVAFSDW